MHAILVLTGRVIRDLVVASANTLRLKQTFVRQVSHEIRQVLAIMMTILMDRVLHFSRSSSFAYIA